jgi:aldose 1-epimerase
MISIGSGDATVRIEAAHGGRIAALDVGGKELLVGPAPERGPMNWGSFPMVPWAGRIRRGQFSFDGRHHQLPLDLPPHAIHGTAYRQGWDVGDVADDEMTMGCDLAWALGGRAWQRVEVGESRLTCELGVVAGDDAMPAELGWHPWFVKPQTLTFRPDSMYARDDEGIPSGELVSPPPGPWDDCFVNTEPVELHYPELTVTVTSDCDHWVVYDEPSHATCVEPQSGPPDAFNLRPRLLQPGERLIRTMTIQWIDRRWGDRLASHDRATMR